MTQRSLAAQNAKERFLFAASEHLIASSPRVSARLGSQYLQTRTSGQSEHRLCAGCGIWQVPGWSCVKGSRSVPVQRRGHETKTESPKLVKARTLRRLRCDICGTGTSISERPSLRTPNVSNVPQAAMLDTNDTAKVSPSPPSRSEVTLTGTPPQKQTPTSTPTSESDVAENLAATKKRNRTKKPSGLQALLAQRRLDASKPALDLMDFMKDA